MEWTKQSSIDLDQLDFMLYVKFDVVDDFSLFFQVEDITLSILSIGIEIQSKGKRISGIVAIE